MLSVSLSFLKNEWGYISDVEWGVMDWIELALDRQFEGVCESGDET